MRGLFSFLRVLYALCMVVRYTSTRDAKVDVNIAEAIVQGMPQDGGLFVPRNIPTLSPEAILEPKLSYAELAWLVLSPWFDWSETELRPLIEKAYSSSGKKSMFDTPEIVLLSNAGSPNCENDLAGKKESMQLFLLELFHGRTCAFKDLALSILGGLLSKSLEKCGIDEPVLVLTATSGDTGSAALAGLGGQQGIRIAVIYPAEGTSEIQRLQMTSVPLEDRCVIGLKGTFDDAQRAVKNIFQSAKDPRSPFFGIRLSSANSINIGRLLPQIVYYVKAWRDLYSAGAINCGESFDVVVPSGNFGDILAARYAKAMGLPIRRLVCASNSNRILYDFFATGIYDKRRAFNKTLSPSMDILVSSNLERLLYHAFGENSELVLRLMHRFENEGFFQIPEQVASNLSDFYTGWADDFQTLESIRHMWEIHNLLVDPHTAVACKVAHEVFVNSQYHQKDRKIIEAQAINPIVIAATASPFKFPASCLAALQSNLKNSPIAHNELSLAFELSSYTGISVPKPIADLVTAKINHNMIVEESNLESVLADFANKTAKPQVYRKSTM